MNNYDLTTPLFFPGRNFLLESLHPKVGETICEIGCGTARNLIKLNHINQNANLVGLDASAEMVKIAKSKVKKTGLEKKIVLYNGLAENFEFEEQIDTFLFIYSLSMISKPNEALICTFNQLPPGGKIHILDFGNFKFWPIIGDIIKGFLNVFKIKPNKDILEKTFELNKESKLEIKNKMGGYNYSAIIQRGNF